MSKFIYTLERGCLRCEGEEVEIGDEFDFNLNPQPSITPWAEVIRVKITNILSTRPVGSYEFEYDESLVAGFQLNKCNLNGLPKCLDCCDLIKEIKQVKPNGDGTSSVENLDGSDQTCFIECPPQGTLEGSVPKATADGGITWGEDLNTTYEFSFTKNGSDIIFTAVSSDGDVTTGTVGDSDTQDVSDFFGNTDADGNILITHESSAGVTTVSIPPKTVVTTNTQADGDIEIIADGVVVGLFPADDDSGNVTQVINADGSVTNTHTPSGFSWTTNKPVVHNGDFSASRFGNDLIIRHTSSGGANQDYVIPIDTPTEEDYNSDFKNSQVGLADRTIGTKETSHFGYNASTFGEEPTSGQHSRIGIYVKDGSGNKHSEIVNSEEVHGRTILVNTVSGSNTRTYSIDGVNFTSNTYDHSRPFLTYFEAETAAQDGDTIIVEGNETNIDVRKNVKVDLSKMTTISRLTIFDTDGEVSVIGKPVVTTRLHIRGTKIGSKVYVDLGDIKGGQTGSEPEPDSIFLENNLGTITGSVANVSNFRDNANSRTVKVEGTVHNININLQGDILGLFLLGLGTSSQTGSITFKVNGNINGAVFSRGGVKASVLTDGYIKNIEPDDATRNFITAIADGASQLFLEAKQGICGWGGKDNGGGGGNGVLYSQVGSTLIVKTPEVVKFDSPFNTAVPCVTHRGRVVFIGDVVLRNEQSTGAPNLTTKNGGLDGQSSLEFTGNVTGIIANQSTLGNGSFAKHIGAGGTGDIMFSSDSNKTNGANITTGTLYQIPFGNLTSGVTNLEKMERLNTYDL